MIVLIADLRLELPENRKIGQTFIERIFNFGHLVNPPGTRSQLDKIIGKFRPAEHPPPMFQFIAFHNLINIPFPGIALALIPQNPSHGEREERMNHCIIGLPRPRGRLHGLPIGQIRIDVFCLQYGTGTKYLQCSITLSGNTSVSRDDQSHRNIQLLYEFPAEIIPDATQQSRRSGRANPPHSGTVPLRFGQNIQVTVVEAQQRIIGRRNLIFIILHSGMAPGLRTEPSPSAYSTDRSGTRLRRSGYSRIPPAARRSGIESCAEDFRQVRPEHPS